MCVLVCTYTSMEVSVLYWFCTQSEPVTLTNQCAPIKWHYKFWLVNATTYIIHIIKYTVCMCACVCVGRREGEKCAVTSASALVSLTATDWLQLGWQALLSHACDMESEHRQGGNPSLSSLDSHRCSGLLEALSFGHIPDYTSLAAILLRILRHIWGSGTSCCTVPSVHMYKCTYIRMYMQWVYDAIADLPLRVKGPSCGSICIHAWERLPTYIRSKHVNSWTPTWQGSEGLRTVHEWMHWGFL